MYLVTGGSGFCGVEVVKHLIKNGEKIRVLDVEPLPEKMDEVDFVKADIRNESAVSEACEGINRIIHAAAKVPISKAGKVFWEVNVDGTRNLLEGALKNNVQKIVHISSSAVQSLDNSPVDEYAPYNPVGPFARSKMEAEIVCKEYIKKGLNVDIIRPKVMLGEGRLGIFQILFDWVSEGKKIYIIGKGNNKLQFLSSQDLASCCYLVSLRNDSNIYNIGSREYSTLREDLQYLLDYANTGSRIVSLPVTPTVLLLRLLDFFHLSPLAPWHYLTYHKDFYFTNKRAKAKLNWEPKYGNKEIFKITYDWYLKCYKGSSHDYGLSHRKALKQGILKLLKMLS